MRPLERVWAAPLPAELLSNDDVAGLGQELELVMHGWQRGLSVWGVRELEAQDEGFSLLRMVHRPTSTSLEVSSTMDRPPAYEAERERALAAIARRAVGAQHRMIAAPVYLLDASLIVHVNRLHRRLVRDLPRVFSSQQQPALLAELQESVSLISESISKRAFARAWPVAQDAEQLNTAYQRLVGGGPLRAAQIAAPPFTKAARDLIEFRDLPSLSGLLDEVLLEYSASRSLPRKQKGLRRRRASDRFRLALDAYALLAFATESREYDLEVLAGSAMAAVSESRLRQK